MERSYDRTPDIVVRPRKSRFRDADSPESHNTDESPTSALPVIKKLSQEEIMEEVVRSRMIRLKVILSSLKVNRFSFNFCNKFFFFFKRAKPVISCCADVKSEEIVDGNTSRRNE